MTATLQSVGASDIAVTCPAQRPCICSKRFILNLCKCVGANVLDSKHVIALSVRQHLQRQSSVFVGAP